MNINQYTLAHLDQPSVLNHINTDESQYAWETKTLITPASAQNQLGVSNFSPSDPAWSFQFHTSGGIFNTFDDPKYDFGTNAFTFECWFQVNLASNGSMFIASQGNLTVGWGLYISNANNIVFRNANTTICSAPAGTLVDGQWYHLAVVRTSTAIGGLKIYLDGVLKGTSTVVSGNYSGYVDNYIQFGYDLPNWNYGFCGKLADIRISSGAIYTADFSRPTAPLQPDANTLLLLSTTNPMPDATLATSVSKISSGPFEDPIRDTTHGSALLHNSDSYVLIKNYANSSLVLGTDPFTIEFWFQTSYAGNKMHVLSNSEFGISVAPGYNYVRFYGSITADATLPSNTVGCWNHVAVVRAGTGTNQAYIFFNGKLLKTFTLSQNIYQLYDWKIGGSSTVNDGSAAATKLYLSNIHVAKTAKYTSDFTPSRIISAIPETSYLSFKVPNFPNAGPVSEGSMVVDTFATRIANMPLYMSNGVSIYNSDSTSGYIKTNTLTTLSPGVEDFTIECFTLCRHPVQGDPMHIFDCRVAVGDVAPAVRVNAALAFEVVFGNKLLITSNDLLKAGVWQHVVLQRVNGVVALYIDGVLQDQVPFATSLTASDVKIGGSTLYTQRGWYGAISNFRVTSKYAVYSNDPYNHQVVVESNCESLTDYKGKLFTATGNAIVSTGQKYSGSSSFYFDGNGDYFTFPAGQDCEIGTDDFTIEFWVRPASGKKSGNASYGQTLLDFRPASTNGNYLAIGFNDANTGKIYISHNSAGVLTSTGSLNFDQWQHIAFTRKNGVAYLYINGNLDSSATFTGPLKTTTNAYLGTSAFRSVSTQLDYMGYIDEFRITKGIARYTESFTPASYLNSNTDSIVVPTESLSIVPNTKLLALSGTSPFVTDLSGSNSASGMVNNLDNGNWNITDEARGPFVVRNGTDTLEGFISSYSSAWTDAAVGITVPNNFLQDLSLISTFSRAFTIDLIFFGLGVDTTSVSMSTPFKTTDTISASSPGFSITQSSKNGAASAYGLDVRINGTNFYNSTAAVKPVISNSWNVVTIVYDPSYSSVKLTVYINGMQYVTSASPAWTKLAAGGLLPINASWTSGIGAMKIQKNNRFATTSAPGAPLAIDVPDVDFWNADSNTVLLLKNKSSFKNKGSGFTVLPVGNIVPVTSKKKFGSGSWKITQSIASYLQLGYNGSITNNSIGRIDYNSFTFETWIAPEMDSLSDKVAMSVSLNSVNSGIAVRTNSSGYWSLSRYSNATYDDRFVSSIKAVNGQFTHLALMFKKGVFFLFIDGVLAGKYNADISTNGMMWTLVNSNGAYIGRSPYGETSSMWSGYFQGVRFCNAAIYRPYLINGSIRMCDAFSDLNDPVLPKLELGLDEIVKPVETTPESKTYVEKYPSDSFAAQVVCSVEVSGGEIKDITGLNPVTLHGNFGPFATGSAYMQDANAICFTGQAPSFIELPDSSNFDFSTSSSVTIEAWVKWAGGTGQTLWGQCPGTTQNMGVGITAATGVLTCYSRTDTSVVGTTAAGTISPDVWTHIAFVKNGSAYYLYVNGVSVTSFTDGTALTNVAYPYQIGGQENVNAFNGLMSNFRITKAARYTGTFTPPARG